MVGTTLNKETYAITSASTGAMDIPFRYDDNSWIYAVAFSGDGETTTNLTLGSDFTLSGDGSQSLGEITLSADFLETISTATLVVYRIAPALQTLDLQYNTRLPAEALEAALDTLAMASIDRSNILQRTFTLPFSDPESFASSYVIESANERKGTVMAFSTVDGKPVRLTYAEIAPLILEYYGLEITSDDVLAAISAIAPLEIFDVPDINTPGKFGQLAIIPELVDLVISGTLSPAIGGTVLPWKVENGKRWFSTSGEDPEIDGLPESVLIGWTGSSWTILYYVEGVAQSTAWVSLPGAWNDDPYPNNVPTWVPLGGATGQPDIALSNLRTSRAWVNLAPNGMVPDWKEIRFPDETDLNNYRVICQGDSIMFGFDMGPGENIPDRIESDPYWNGKSVQVYNLAENGTTLAGMISRYEDDVYPLRPQSPEDVCYYLINVGTNDPGIANDTWIETLNTHVEEAQGDGFIVIVNECLPRTIGSDFLSIRSSYIRTRCVCDRVVDTAWLMRDPSDTFLFLDGLHPTARGYFLMAERIMAVISGVLPSRPSDDFGTMARQQANAVAITGGSATFDQGLTAKRTGSNSHQVVQSDVGFDSGTYWLNTDNRGFVFEYSPANGEGRFQNLTSGSFVKTLSFDETTNIATFISGVVGKYFQTGATYANDAAAAAATPPVPVGGWYARTSDNQVVRRSS